MQLRPHEKEKAMTTNLKQQAKAATADVVLETTKEYSSRLLKDGKFAMNESRNNPELFQAGRRDQLRLNLRGANPHERLQAVRQGWDADQARSGTLTAAQVDATVTYTLEKIKAMPASEVLQLKKDKPQEYAKYRLSAATLGYLPDYVLTQVNVPDVVVVDEQLQTIPAVVASKLGLDATLRVTKAGLDKALEAFGNAVAAEKIAAIGTPAVGAE
jgi:hypothetical protein